MKAFSILIPFQFWFLVLILILILLVRILIPKFCFFHSNSVVLIPIWSWEGTTKSGMFTALRLFVSTIILVLASYNIKFMCSIEKKTTFWKWMWKQMTRVYPVHHFLLFPKGRDRNSFLYLISCHNHLVTTGSSALPTLFGNSKKWWTGEIPCHLFPHSFSKVFSNSLRTQDKSWILCESRTKKMIVETKSRKAVVNIPLFAVPSQLQNK